MHVLVKYVLTIKVSMKQKNIIINWIPFFLCFLEKKRNDNDTFNYTLTYL